MTGRGATETKTTRGGQHHLIRRQTLELEVRSEEQARTLQAELRRIHDSHIVPLLDRF